MKLAKYRENLQQPLRQATLCFLWKIKTKGSYSARTILY